jgi:peptidoglycan/LPS O-acetylase OafA/YrhL
MSQNVTTLDLVSPQPETAVRETEFRLGHRPELDGLRGISILLVFLHHLWFRFLPGGFLGVDIFFVLSGFLITSLLVQEYERRGRISLRHFYIRRALRLGPALVVFMAGLGLYALCFLDRARAADVYQGILLTASYVSNWVFALKPSVKIGALGITWSLAIEEQFYLVWPLLLSLALRFKLSRRTIVCTLILAILAIALHRRMLTEYGAVIRRLYYATDTRADALLIGCLVALLLSWRFIPQTRWFRPVINAVAITGALFVIYLATTADTALLSLYLGWFTLVALAIGLNLIVLMLWPPAWALQLLRTQPLAWFGRISYALYLWHYPVRAFICPDNGARSIWRVLLTAIISVGIAALSFYLIEKRFLRLKDRFARTQLKGTEVVQVKTGGDEQIIHAGAH